MTLPEDFRLSLPLLTLLDMKFILLIDVKMPSISNLTFLSKINNHAFLARLYKSTEELLQSPQRWHWRWRWRRHRRCLNVKFFG